MAINFGALVSGYTQRQSQIRDIKAAREETRRKNIRSDFHDLLADPNVRDEVKGQLGEELLKLDNMPLVGPDGNPKEYKYNPQILVPQHHKTTQQIQKEATKAQQDSMPDPSTFTLGDVLGPVMQARAKAGGTGGPTEPGTLSAPVAGSQSGASFQTPAPMMGQAPPLVPPPQGKSLPEPPPAQLTGGPGPGAGAGPGQGQTAGALEPPPSGTGAGAGAAGGAAATGGGAGSAKAGAVVEPPPGLPPEDEQSWRMSAEEIARRQKKMRDIETTVDIPHIPDGMTAMDYLKSGPRGLTAGQLGFVKDMAGMEVQQAVVRQQRIDSELNSLKSVNLIGYKTPEEAVQAMRMTYPIAASSPGFDGFVIGNYAQQKELHGEHKAAADIQNQYRQFMQEDRERQRTIENDAVSGLVDGVKKGLLPAPEAMRSPLWTRAQAQLAKDGFNVAQAASDWKATQSYVKTLNSQQQVAMRQNVYRTRHSLDLLKSIAEEWNAGGFPILNSARLSAAKSGVLGPQAQSIAARIEAQAADLTTELGSVFSSGYAMTDDKLKLASENLQSKNWGKRTLGDLIDNVEKNLVIREGSLSSSAPVTPDGANPYFNQSGSSGVVEPPPNSQPPGVKNFQVVRQ